MKNIPTYKAMWLIIVAMFFSVSLAKLEPSSLFSDGMVLQQKKPIKVWGLADKGALINVEFGNMTAESRVDEQGKWIVELPAQVASKESQSMTITDGDETVIIKDVLIGEVWLASGQSNMEWSLKQLTSRAKHPKYQVIVEFMKQAIATGSDPLLRQIKVPKKSSLDKKLESFKAQWIDSNPANNSEFSAVAYFFAKELRRELDVPVGIILSAWRGTRVEPWIPQASFIQADEQQYYIENHQDIKQQQIARQKVLAQAKEQGIKYKLKRIRYQDVAASLYNGMIHPLINCSIKGVIWYQGESNSAHNSTKYAQYFERLITSWREAFKQGDIPFYYCQLAGYKPKYPNGWLAVCNQQRQVLNTAPHTGMAVLNDIGEAKDVHPRNKLDVGKRLALWALAKDYGKSDLVYSGPLYQNYKIKRHQVVVSFNNVGSGLQIAKKNLLEEAKAVNEELYGFELCGADGKWHAAKAHISSANTVTVSSEQVTNPVHVRYGWKVYSDQLNLYNKEGLPTSLFTTQ